MKIAFLGDSLTRGSYGGSFVREVSRRLPQHEIINAGENGNTIINLLNRLNTVLELEPDGIFVMTGGNDAISYSQPATRPYYKRTGGAPDGIMTLELFARSYRDLLLQIQLAHVLVWVGLPPAEYNPPVVEATRQFNQLAGEIAASMNIPALDLMAQFTPRQIRERPPLDIPYISLIGQREKSGWDDYENERQREGFSFTFDGLHLTPESAVIMGECVVKFLDIS
jgi:lysophospholipase L1-like esterase